MSDKISSFLLNFPDHEIDDLIARLKNIRWPDSETVTDWSQGVPLERARLLIDYWSSHYDWRRCENMLNDFGQYKTEIGGLGIHFLHVRSPESNALPLLLTHGWPGSVIEFHKIIGPLTDPVAYGGDPRDAFHVVVPSLPGYGLSDKPTQVGWGVTQIAKTWALLMERLGYDRYVAQGGDWGAGVTTAMALAAPAGLAAIHLNLPIVIPPNPGDDLDDEQKAALTALSGFQRWDSGYALLQASRPQTIGYGLADSPLAQAMWIYEKFWKWTDSDGDPENVLTRDEMLDIITLYWLTNSGASSARLYWESYHGFFHDTKIQIPVGCSIFPGETYLAPRRWAEAFYSNIIHWNKVEKGGHFAAFEQPGIFVDELRSCFRQLR